MSPRSNVDVDRILAPPQKRSFFLFGPRGVGKSTWLAKRLAPEVHIDLLRTRDYLALSRDPGELEARVAALKPGSWVILDEVQRAPGLLSEVHRLIEQKKLLFALTGSSARKLRSGAADMLGGRALRRNMEPFVSAELKSKFSLAKVLEYGALPLVYLDPENAVDTLDVYVHTYLKEEIKEEGLVRKLDPFVRFIDVVGLLNGQVLNLDSIARDARVPRSTLDTYFSILEDTLVGYRLPPYQPRAKVRELSHPKFYWFDPGVARACANRLRSPLDPAWLGFALETWIYHELRVYGEVSGKRPRLYYYATQSGGDIDFVIELEPAGANTKASVILLEIKSSKKWDRSWNKSMLSLEESRKVRIKKMVGVYCGTERLQYGNVQVLPVSHFLHTLFEGGLF